jgi:subtilisin family serine protease
MLDMGNLAEAIGHAAGPDRSLVKRRADVISISLGGAPSRALREAVRRARLANVIVLAAAGNQVRTVVWPARYADVIAVCRQATTTASPGRARAVVRPCG